MNCVNIDSQNIFKGITKQDLCKFLHIPNTNSVKVSDLKSQVLDMLSDEDNYKCFIDMFEEQTAISPSDLEGILGCTRFERLRWTKEGKLKVVDYKSFKYGDYPIFSRYQIEKEITLEVIDLWRKEHNDKLHGQTDESKLRAKNTKAKRADKRKQVLADFNQQMSVWEEEDSLLANTYGLAYWTMWISRLAKSYQLKINTCNHKNIEKYEDIVDECYQKKNKSLFSLVNSSYTKVYFYRPNNPDKIHFHLCDYHYDQYREESWLGNCSIWDYLYANIDKIKSCSNCEYEEDKDYYSLYYFEIGDKFSFHMPYSVGYPILGCLSKFPKIEHEEQEGMFRFGRSLTDDELYIFTLAFVNRQFDRMLANFGG